MANEGEVHVHDSFESDASRRSPGSHCTLYRLPALKEPFQPHKKIQHRNHNWYPKSHGCVTGFHKNQTQALERQRKIQLALSSELGLGDTWEANQNLIASLKSENHYLKCQLKQCQGELKTVERQCKVQNARLTKTVSKELEMPELINRLNGEIRALQFHLNRQREATAAAEKRAGNAETRLRERREVRDAPDDSENFRKIAKKQIRANEALKIELEDERRKVKDLQRKVDTMEQKLRAEQNLANEQIRKLRKNCGDLQTKLENTERNLQNIYTQRIPKTALMKNAELDFQQAPNCYIDEVLNSISTSYRQASRSQPPPTLTSRANKIPKRNPRKPQATNCTISNMITKRNDNSFAPPNAGDVLGTFEKVEHRESFKSMDEKNDQQSHHQSSVDKVRIRVQPI
ncbi:unnamed protein product [Hymenolepis diminuta]|uniref:Uncharacterized protein n=1 Tax=Hymenolepis diminuta TaxID=6216 RepID=A0A564YJC5_HYMDI|nr:unnamed protein product [Hymenolepis diminuta]